MEERRRGPGAISSRAPWGWAALALFPVAVALATTRAKGDDVHRSDAACTACHSVDAAALRQDTAAARALLAPDLERRCHSCHGDGGVSHPSDVLPARAVPQELPLSTEGRITCATCHFMHGESRAFADFVRVDNRRGELCLACHELSELE